MGGGGSEKPNFEWTSFTDAPDRIKVWVGLSEYLPWQKILSKPGCEQAGVAIPLTTLACQKFPPKVQRKPIIMYLARAWLKSRPPPFIDFNSSFDGWIWACMLSVKGTCFLPYTLQMSTLTRGNCSGLPRVINPCYIGHLQGRIELNSKRPLWNRACLGSQKTC